MSSINFLIQGSTPEPYEVVFTDKGNGRVSASCNCSAGKMNQYCKHRFSIISGDGSSIVSDNKDQVKEIVDMVQGSNIFLAIEEFLKEEKEANEIIKSAKKRISIAKKNIAKSMM